MNINKEEPLYDINGRKFEVGQTVSIDKHFDDVNEEFGYVISEFGKLQIIGIAKKYSDKTGFYIGVARINDINVKAKYRQFKVVDNIKMEHSLEEVKDKLCM